MVNYSVPLATRTVLEARLKSTTSPWDRLPLLLELTQESSAQDHRYGIQRAYEALNLARQLKDQFWIARSMRAIGGDLTLTSRYSEILYYLEKSSTILGELNETALKAQADLAIANTYIRMGEMEKAIPLISFSLNVFRNVRDFYWLAVSYRVLGDVHKAVSDHANAIRHYRKAISILSRNPGVHGDAPSALGGLYQNLAEIYSRINDRNRTKKYLFRSFAILKEAGNYPPASAALGNIATCYLQEKNFSRAEKYVRLSGGMFRAIGYTDGEAMAWTKLGVVYAHNLQKDKAIRCYRKALAVARNTENLYVKSTVLQKFGCFHLDNGEHRRGRSLLQAALDLYKPKGHAYVTHTLHWSLAQAYEAEGNAAEALRHMKEHQRLKEESVNAEKYQQASRAEVEGHIRRLVRELKKEQAENDTLRREIEEKETALLALTLSLVRREEENRKGGNTINCATDGTGNADLSNWDVFARQFHKVHHNFYPNLLKRFPALTATEAKVCSLIRTGLSSKEIAGVLGISVRTVENHRARIHKKMDLPPGSSLADFITRI